MGFTIFSIFVEKPLFQESCAMIQPSPHRKYYKTLTKIPTRSEKGRKGDPNNKQKLRQLFDCRVLFCLFPLKIEGGFVDVF